MPPSQNVFRRHWITVTLLCLFLLSGACVAFVVNRQSGSDTQPAVQTTTVQPLGVGAVENAESEYQRALKLSASNATTDEEVDRRKSLFNRAQHFLEQTRSQLAALTTIRPEDVQVASAELAKAEAGVIRAQAEWEDTQVRAPIAGRVLKIFARPGERIGTDGLAEIGDTANMQAVAEVHERDAPLVKIGQPAIVKVQSLTGEITGQVVHVGWKVGRRVVLDNDPVKDTDARVVEVRIQLDTAANQRVAGLSYARVEVRIDIRGGQ
ncbi:MAG: HlyD family efflux transporter periplasmic adaptor subunit [Planctomycetota bacterium]|nr:MAG: HlyD family efflux transporter periplasmic adaptor subunit [Planctomycetota bacterium]